MKINRLFSQRILMLCCLMLASLWGWGQTTYYLTSAGASNAQTAGSWNTIAAGGGTAATIFTNSGDVFNIPSGRAATFASGTSTTFASGVTLQVDGSFTIGNGTTNAVSAVTINGNIVFTNAAATQYTITAGAGSGSANFTLGASAKLTTNNSNGIIGSNCSISTIPGKATITLNPGANFEFNGAAQSTTGLPAAVNNVTLSGSGAKALGTTTVNGILSIENGTAFNTFVALTYGTAATLQYNAGSSSRTVSTEWPTNWANASGGVIIKGTGIITLNGVKTFTAPLSVKDGATLALATFALGATTSLTLENGGANGSAITGTGTLTLGGNVTVNYTGSGTGDASITCPLALGAAIRTFTVANDAASGIDLTIGGIVSSSGGGITKAGAGTMVLSRANTYTGVTTISAGILNLQNATAAGTTAGGVTVASGAALQLQGGIAVGAETLSLNGTGIANDGALRSVTGTGTTTNSWGGNITLVTNAVRINSDVTTTLSLAAISATNINLSLGGLGNITVTGAITTGTGSMTDDGPGNVIFSGTNTYSGATTIAAGITSLGKSNVFANNSSLVLGGGTFKTGNASAGFTDAMGTLTLSANSTFALVGSTAHTMSFAASNGVAWSGTTLTVNGWTGTGGSTGTAGKIVVGTTAAGLTAGQLAKFSFTGYAPGAIQLSSGEVVPTPSPAITSALTASSTYGAAGSYFITGSYTPTSYNATGLPAGITVNTATGEITIAATTVAGTYAITISAINGSGTGSATLNYTVNTAALTVTATGPSKTYGTALAAGTSTTNFSIAGTPASGEALTSVTLTPNAAGLSTTTAAGAAYVVTPSAATGTGGFLTSNYNITYTAYSGTVATKSLTITASDQAKCAGTTLSFAGSEFVATGLVNGNTVTSVALSSGGSASPATAGTYPIVASVASGSGLANYTIAYVNGSLTVTAALTASVSIVSNAPANTTCSGTNVTFTATAVNGGTSPVYQWKLNGTNVGSNSATYSNAALANNDLVTVVMTSNATPCLTGSPATSNGIVITVQNSWTGGDGNWNNAANWSCGSIPSGTDNIVINSGNPKMNNDFTVAGSLTLGGSSTLTIEPGHVLTISGAADFGGRPVTVQSSASGTAAIGRITGTLSNATNVTVERYIGTSKKGWRFLTIPVTGQTIRDAWAGAPANATAPLGETGGTGTLITGHGAANSTGLAATTNGFDWWTGLGVNTTSSIRFYTPSGWTSATNTPNIKSTPDKQGYLVYVRGDRTVTSGAANPTTLKPTGTLKTGTQTYNVNMPYTVIGNPYASAINIDQVYNNAGNSDVIDRTFYTWDATIGIAGGYAAISWNGKGYNKSNGTASVAEYLNVNSGQAFFVKQKGTGSIVITDSNKVTASTARVFRPVGNNMVGSVAIRLFNATGAQSDGVLARYNDIYSADANETYDVPKMNNLNENISLVRNGSYLSIESRPYPTRTDTLFIPFWGLAQGSYTLRMNADDFAGANQIARLEDRFAKTKTVVGLAGDTTAYKFGITSDTASSSLSRFMIVMEPMVVLPVHFIQVSATIKTSKVQVAFSTGSETGVKNYSIEKSTDGTRFSQADSLPAKNAAAGASYQWLDEQPNAGINYYRIRSNDMGGRVQYSTVAKVQFNGRASIQVTPTVITNHRFTLAMNQQAAGNYNVQLSNGMGQQVFQKRIVYNGGNSSQEVDLGRSALTTGLYQLCITDAAGNQEHFSLLINR